jgi:excisionase family DNA binding protein
MVTDDECSGMYEPLMTAKALAEYLGTPVNWVYDNQHQIPGFRLGREFRFRRTEIDSWLEEQRLNRMSWL